MKLTRQEFNQAIGDALRAVRVDRGLSQEEAAERINAIPEAERRKRDIHIVAVYGTLSVALRQELGLTQKQLAKRSGVPLALLRDFEAGEVLSPELYFLYCLSVGFDLSLSDFMRRAKELSEMLADEVFEDDADEEENQL